LHGRCRADSLIPDSLNPEFKPLSPETGSGKVKEIIYSELFNAFWKEYPGRNGHKGSKKYSFKIWQTKLTDKERELSPKAAMHYAASDDARRGYAKDASTFLNQDDIISWASGDAIVKPLTLEERLERARKMEESKNDPI
jgi:hypothetical protein